MSTKPSDAASLRIASGEQQSPVLGASAAAIGAAADGGGAGWLAVGG